MPEFCPGYVSAPFKSLATNYPDSSVYPLEDFRVEWGPIFHRGRLDGSARVLLIGQDPGQHENVVRRILVGEAGRRAQGLLAKLGITRSYVLVNALLYSVYGNGGAKYVAKPAVREYRERWLEALLASDKIEAVVTFGTMAKTAWSEYVAHHAAPSLQVAHLTHPTFPESAGGGAAEKRANLSKMLMQWNQALPALHAALTHKDEPNTPLVLYGQEFLDGDRREIPAFDLPAGIPRWMYTDDGWARRVGSNPLDKRRNITITVPEEALQ